MGMYEEETCQWLQSNLGDGCVFFDIGANAGYFTLLGSQLVGASGTVVAFEPVPVNVQVVSRQAELNECANVRIEPCALTNSNGPVSFAIEARNANSHLSELRISHAASAPSATVTVPGITLDDWVSQNGILPDVLKIDVEGAEQLVLEGAARTLSEARPRLILSTHSGALKEACRAMLEEKRYRIIPLPGFEHELVAYPRP